ncbi:Acyl-CoA synthetase (AMP-forming)/AMP-acid ligase II [Mesobacillus persicus]|uniref:Acyl-CoA synthetase (AMP-forming)/AMP-acid ligase II n=1 Tax=Mesobacillus persicus TaxID=930146 RepID=A0A1H8DDI9_9BACI|nr:AMP-binding protein [Mesobacillus persicus]SEN04547.1 Acyl-CoA synthetase (AMP-forming)/AMP-acid ligase II [Mesobacillus persicus]
MNAYLLLNIAGSIVPDQEILTFGTRRQTYAQVIERTGLLASALASYGVRQGDRVGIISTNSPEVVEAFFATFQLGATVVPINYRAKAEELAFMLEDAGLKVLLIEKRYADLLEPLAADKGIARTIIVDGYHRVGQEYEEVIQSSSHPLIDFADVDDSDLAILLYTSGTTSRPKGVMITYGQLSNYVMGHSEAADGLPKGASMIVVPNYHVAGATSICNGIYSGRRLILLRQFEAEDWLQTVEKEKATHAFLVPTMLKRVIDHPNFSKTNLSSLQSLSYGAAPMPFPVIRRAIELFPKTTEFANGFGMTETTSTVSVLGPEDHKLTGSKKEIEKKIQRLSSVGKPLPGVDILIMDDNHKPVEANTIGNVYVRTERSMKGYWKRPDASSETIINGWINTKDMGWLDEDGYLFLSGRSSDMIIRGGENISPQEIEDVLLEHEEVSDVAVIGTPSLDWGEEVMAVIVATNPEASPQPEELIAHCRKYLASFKCPVRIEFVTELPQTSSGKILKKDLREQFLNVSQTKN